MTQKEKTFLDQTAQRLHLTVDGESSILFGSVGGYQTMLWRNDQGLAVMTLSLHKLGQEPDQSAIRQFVKGTRLVTGFSVRRSRVELTLSPLRQPQSGGEAGGGCSRRGGVSARLRL